MVERAKWVCFHQLTLYNVSYMFLNVLKERMFAKLQICQKLDIFIPSLVIFVFQDGSVSYEW